MHNGKSISERCTVVFHQAEPSEAVDIRAKHLMARLLRYFPAIMHGTMTIEGRHRHHHQGNLYHISLRFHLPGGDVVVSHDPERNHSHEDIYVAMRDACRAAQKQLEQAISRAQGAAVRHQRARFEGNPRNPPLHGD
ncbi:MAG: HPF/RaiA family ribosome-associated protein [Pseudomonadota bacterium]|jgi:hypothetical protein